LVVLDCGVLAGRETRGLRGGVKALFARVMETVNGLEAAKSDVGVDLSRGDVGVAEHGLHGAQVGPVVNHMGGAAMTQHVGGGGAAGGLLDERPDGLPGERATVVAEKEAGGAGSPGRRAGAGTGTGTGTGTGKNIAAVLEIALNGEDGGAANGYNALLIALAEDAELTGGELERGD
jgi:hypothetical protein